MENRIKTPVTRQKRRTFLAGLLTVPGLSALPFPARATALTPPQFEGPFYPTKAMRFADVDNDLVKIAGVVQQAGGEIVRLSGRVMDSEGRPIADARVEIWQCDANGRYLHAGDTQDQARDAAFQGFGHDITDNDGNYAFRTIKPVSYPGRAPHIHVKIFAEGRALTTQFYISGEDANLQDRFFSRLSKAEQHSLEMRFQGDQEPEALVDIII